MEIKENYHVELFSQALNPLHYGNIFGVRIASIPEVLSTTILLLILGIIPSILFKEQVGWSTIFFYLIASIPSTDLVNQMKLLVSATKKINLLKLKTYYTMFFEIFIALWIFSNWTKISFSLAVSFLVFWLMSGLTLVLLYTKDFIVKSSEKEFSEICRLYGLSRASFMWASMLIVLTSGFSLGDIQFVLLFAIEYVWLSNTLPYALNRPELLEIKNTISFIDTKGETTINSIQKKFNFSDERLANIIGALYGLTIIGLNSNVNPKKITDRKKLLLLKVSLSDILLI